MGEKNSSRISSSSRLFAQKISQKLRRVCMYASRFATLLLTSAQRPSNLTFATFSVTNWRPCRGEKCSRRSSLGGCGAERAKVELGQGHHCLVQYRGKKAKHNSFYTRTMCFCANISLQGLGFFF